MNLLIPSISWAEEDLDLYEALAEYLSAVGEERSA